MILSAALLISVSYTHLNSVADLAGKTVYATGQGATPEYILNYLLDKNGVAGSVEVNYVGEHAALATMLADGSAEIGMLPEPNVTSTLAGNDNLRIALNLTEEWNKVCSTELVQMCIRDRMRENQCIRCGRHREHRRFFQASSRELHCQLPALFRSRRCV